MEMLSGKKRRPSLSLSFSLFTKSFIFDKTPGSGSGSAEKPSGPVRDPNPKSIGLSIIAAMKEDDRPPTTQPCLFKPQKQSKLTATEKRGTRFQVLEFLRSCYLCRKDLHGLDIYIYRGEKAFCSPECREIHMKSNEAGKGKLADAVDVALLTS